MGLAGISDDQGSAVDIGFWHSLWWNGKDTDIKRAIVFGLTNSESNHGEDVKESYFYLDSTPTHSYLKVKSLIQVPHSPPFPYDKYR
jgi:hypothetical protein